MDGTGRPQSITTRPEVGVINSNTVVFVGTGRFLGASDLSDPATLSPPLPWAYTQSIYAIKDKNTSYGNPRSALVQQTIIDGGSTTRTTSNNPVDFAADNGWFVDFNPANSSPGERVNIDPQLVLGTLVIVTNAPNNNVCTVGGDSFVYQFDYARGTYVATAAGQVVAQRTFGQATVGISLVRATTGAISSEQSLAGGLPPLTQGINVAGSGNTGRRVSWRELLHLQ
jgi:type IV pilus assembly protein PilY1